ncbi:hypothetical protein QTO34_018129 [Cnephaeus nilssonii]|uniref:Retroviral envelope protein GP41-like domain-containing protein n=1 Tax=Cnephaeus nilssonii TaxID=3371016 RepID=A0AA40HYZ1_CNENI|nr:hypothetical protein QTO34_018129 [Eptesicus nilssonii]
MFIEPLLWLMSLCPARICIGDWKCKHHQIKYPLCCPTTLFYYASYQHNRKWYHDAGLQALQEPHNQLSQEKRALGLIIFGLVTLVTVITSAVTTSLALTQNIQNAKFVNELAQKTSTVLHDQEDIDKKLETKLNALEAVVIGLGNQLEISSKLLRSQVQRLQLDVHKLHLKNKKGEM